MGFSTILFYINRNREMLPMRLLLMACMLFTAMVQAQPYDENANAELDIHNALQEARSSGRLMLLEFGANWCPDCIVLADQMRESPLQDLIAENFIVVKVDIGEGEKNADLVHAYGDVTDRGIPSIVVVDQDNRVLLGTLTGQLANARHMGKQELYDFFVAVLHKVSGPAATAHSATAD